jgi:PAS domain S-box-containing protein
MSVEQSPHSDPSKNRDLLRITLIYFIVAVLWILVSETWLSVLIADSNPLVKGVISKGWLFIPATAVLLFIVHQRSLRKPGQKGVTVSESEKRYQTIFENTGTATVIIENDMTISLINAEFEQITGYGKDEIELKLKWTDLIVPEYREKVESYHIDRRTETGSAPHHYETRIINKSSEILDVYMTVSLIPGTMQSLASFVNISDLKKAEAAVAKLAAIVDSSDDAIISKTLDGIIRSWNHSAEGIYGYTADEVIGKNVSILLPEDRPDEVNQILQMLKNGERIDHFETVRKRKDGKLIHVSLTISPIYDSKGKIIGASTIARDITDRIRRDEELRSQQQQLIQADKLATLGILSSGLAHEITNPNNFIMLNSGIIKKAWDDAAPILAEYYESHGDFALAGMPYSQSFDKLTRLLDGLSEGSVRIKRIVQSLKDYVRHEPGELGQSVKLNEVVKSAIVIVNNLIKKSTDHLSISYDESVPEIKGNTQQLEQVVINLITNSCQALTDKKQKLSISTQYDRGSHSVVFRIEDEGRGISDDDMKYIMDPFFTTKRDSGGTGLGLSITSNIIKNHNGSLKINSREGQGTLVTVKIPVYSNQGSNNG